MSHGKAKQFVDRNGQMHEIPDDETLVEKFSVYGLCQIGDYILMCRDRGDKFWTFPGGTADPGESDHDQVLQRESLEEVGIKLKIIDHNIIHEQHELFHDNIKGGYFSSNRYIYKAEATSSNFDANQVISHEIAMFGWVHVDEFDSIAIEPFHKTALTKVNPGAADNSSPGIT